MLYLTADLHFNHEKIIMLSHRPFHSVREMNEALIFNWIKRVKKHDDVYVIGDFSFKSSSYEAVETIFNQLTGRKHLVIGNHDKEEKHVLSLPWNTISDMNMVKYNKQGIFLCHYPIISWPHIKEGTWHAHGHCHGNLSFNMGKMYDVGVDGNDYELLSFDELKTIMDQKPYESLDHHVDDDE